MVQFNQAVRIRSLSILTKSSSQGPKLIKLAINKPSIGFDDMEDAEEPSVSQIITLSEEDVKEGRLIQLRFVRFQSVNSLHVRPSYPLLSSFCVLTARFGKVFVASNQGGEDETRIDAIEIMGVPTG